MNPKMKKLLQSIVSGLLLVNSCYATGLDGDSNENHFRQLLTDSEIAWLDKHERLTYVYDPDWAPFEWKTEEGDHVGIIADLFALLTHNSGLKLEPQNTETWSESVALVREGKADMFSAITVTDERKRYLNFTSRDIYSYPAVLVTKFEDNEVYLDIAKDAHLKTVAIVKESGLGQYIQKRYPDLTYFEVPSTQEGFSAVVDGDADLFAINTITARYYIEKHYQDEIKIATKLDYIYNLKIAVRKDKPLELITILDKALSTISDSEQGAIFKRWTHVEKPTIFNWKNFTQITAIFLIVLTLLAWHNIRLKKLVNIKTRELNDLANTDTLTGAKNRRKLGIDLSHEMKRANRNKRNIALLYIDLNDFKKVNDRYGHKFGDSLLILVTDKMIDSLRDTENLYRLGGDEFCILLPEIYDREQAFHAANRLRKLMAEAITLNEETVQIGCSIGISFYPDDGDNIDALMTKADSDMYRDKTNKG